MSDLSEHTSGIENELSRYYHMQTGDDPSHTFVSEKLIHGITLPTDFSVEHDVTPTIPHLLGALAYYNARDYNHEVGVWADGVIDWLYIPGITLDDKRISTIARLVGANDSPIETPQKLPDGPLQSYALSKTAYLRATQFVYIPSRPNYHPDDIKPKAVKLSFRLPGQLAPQQLRELIHSESVDDVYDAAPVAANPDQIELF
jgi:hypothetical protein